MTAPRHSLRRRLVLGLALASCLLWGGMALWRTHSLEDELNATLDERLVASARMVAGIVHQLQPTVPLPTGVACVVTASASFSAIVWWETSNRRKVSTAPRKSST